MKILVSLALVCLLYGCYKVYDFVTADVVVVQDYFGVVDILEKGNPRRDGFQRFCSMAYLGWDRFQPQSEQRQTQLPCTNYTIFFEVLDMVYSTFIVNFTLGVLALFIGRLGYGYYRKRQAKNNKVTAAR